MTSRRFAVLALAVVTLLLTGCGRDGELRSAVQRVAARGATTLSCDFSGGLVESRSYRCDFRVHAARAEAALAIARTLARRGFAVSCQEGDAGSNDGIDVSSFRGDLRIVAHVMPQDRTNLAVVVDADNASSTWQSLVRNGDDCDPVRVAHLGTAPCIAGWNGNARATALTGRLAARPKVVVQGSAGGCRFLFLTRRGLVLVFAQWHGERLALVARRPLDRWEDNERRIYARNPGVRAHSDGTLSPQPVAP